MYLWQVGAMSLLQQASKQASKSSINKEEYICVFLLLRIMIILRTFVCPIAINLERVNMH
jgi:hypothetical protein